MSVDQANERPTMRWVPVRDATGRTRLEARWTSAQAVRATPVAPAPVAAASAA